MRAEQGELRPWAVPSSSFVSGSEVLKDEHVVECALTDLPEPSKLVLFCDVGQMNSAHSSSEVALQKRARRIGEVIQLQVEVEVEVAGQVRLKTNF